MSELQCWIFLMLRFFALCMQQELTHIIAFL
jgi:hypothetical protein